MSASSRIARSAGPRCARAMIDAVPQKERSSGICGGVEPLAGWRTGRSRCRRSIARTRPATSSAAWRAQGEAASSGGAGSGAGSGLHGSIRGARKARFYREAGGRDAIISSQKIMRILLSNDDGYFAPGLAALAEGLAPLGEITVVAPERDRSGASNSLTLDRPLQLAQRAQRLLYVNGTPTDCVHMAVTGLLDFEPDVRRLRHQHRLQHGRRHALLGHGRRGDRGLPAGHSVDRGLARRATSSSTSPPPRAWRASWSSASRARPFGAPVLLNVNVPDVPYEALAGHRGHAPGPAPQGAARGDGQEPARRDGLLGRRRGRGARGRARAPTSTRSSAARCRSRRCRSTSRTPGRSRWSASGWTG